MKPDRIKVVRHLARCQELHRVMTGAHVEVATRNTVESLLCSPEERTRIYSVLEKTNQSLVGKQWTKVLYRYTVMFICPGITVLPFCWFAKTLFNYHFVS